MNHKSDKFTKEKTSDSYKKEDMKLEENVKSKFLDQYLKNKK
jgi:hypothetical protein